LSHSESGGFAARSRCRHQSTEAAADLEGHEVRISVTDMWALPTQNTHKPGMRVFPQEERGNKGKGPGRFGEIGPHKKISKREREAASEERLRQMGQRKSTSHCR